jgi:hypothetical protein
MAAATAEENGKAMPPGGKTIRQTPVTANGYLRAGFW